jgi:urease accessory protein UreF
MDRAVRPVPRLLMDADADAERYVLLLLADSGLPTGAFVASAGLESYIAHGFLGAGAGGPRAFLAASLDSYAHAALPFVGDAHAATIARLDGHTAEEDCVQRLAELDALYDAMTLSVPARRASRAQGVALLTLYARGFAPPAGMGALSEWDARAGALVAAFKAAVRAERTPGHLPVCWAILTSALGLSAGPSLPLRSTARRSADPAVHRTRTPPAPVPPRARHPLRRRPAERARAVRHAAAARARRPPARRRRGRCCGRGEGRGRRGGDVATWRDPRRPARSPALAHLQQLRAQAPQKLVTRLCHAGRDLELRPRERAPLAALIGGLGPSRVATTLGHVFACFDG